MKKLLFTLMILTLYSCEGTILDYDENKEYIENKKNITYYMGTPFSGTIIRKEGFYRDRKSKTTYKNGKKDGLYEEYYKDIIMKDGEVKDGQVKIKETYKNGKEDGLYESYYEDGQLKRKKNYKNGVLDGLYEEYGEYGQVKLKTTYKNGLLDGLYEEYGEDAFGPTIIKENYKNGEIIYD